MDPRDLADTPFGRVTRTPGDRWAFWYFDPAPIPRDLILDPRTVLALPEADAALGHPQGHLIRDPQLLIGPYVTRGALARARIEGTRASLLSVLEGPAGPRQTAPVVAACFGIGHYYGVIGVLLAGFLAWILALSMKQTRGVFQAWFVHFWQDVLNFSFRAVGAITPGA